LEKLVSEELCLHYGKEYDMEFRITRFHNIYGPNGTWRGGREKSPAAFCRKALVSETDFEMWGDGEQTRSFCFIDDAVEGVLRLMRSDYKQVRYSSNNSTTCRFAAVVVLTTVTNLFDDG
jgi:GDP-D-mannose 3', 5'-epimerase